MADMTMRLRSSSAPGRTGLKSSSITTADSVTLSSSLGVVAAVQFAQHGTFRSANMEAGQLAIAEAPAVSGFPISFVIVAVAVQPMVLSALLPEEHVFHGPDALGGIRGGDGDFRLVGVVHRGNVAKHLLQALNVFLRTNRRFAATIGLGNVVGNMEGFVFVPALLIHRTNALALELLDFLDRNKTFQIRQHHNPACWSNRSQRRASFPFDPQCAGRERVRHRLYQLCRLRGSGLLRRITANEIKEMGLLAAAMDLERCARNEGRERACEEEYSFSNIAPSAHALHGSRFSDGGLRLFRAIGEFGIFGFDQADNDCIYTNSRAPFLRKACGEAEEAGL